MDSRKYIENFNKINISKICNKLKINRTGIANGSTKKENYDKVKEEIENEIAKLYIKD